MKKMMFSCAISVTCVLAAFIAMSLATPTPRHLHESRPTNSEDDQKIPNLPEDGALPVSEFAILEENRGEVLWRVEGDLLVTAEEFKILRGWSSSKMKQARSRNRRKALRSLGRRWPNCTVYFELVKDADRQYYRDAIGQAMDHWSKYTCLKFIEDKTKNSRIQFVIRNLYSSQLGMHDTPQMLTLPLNDVIHGKIVHEIGHAIGLFHEHMRPDRDDYICIEFNFETTVNKELLKLNYKKYSSNVVNTYGIEYDYESIMQYSPLMKARDPRYQKSLGQRQGLSFKDIHLVNLMYNCAHDAQCEYKDCGPHGMQLFREYRGAPQCECWCDSGDLSDPLILCSAENAPPPRELNVTLSCGDASPLIPEPEVDQTPCHDVWWDCDQQASKGECEKNPETMSQVCSRTCGLCDLNLHVCEDALPACPVIADLLCDDPEKELTMVNLCPFTCGYCEPDAVRTMEENKTEENTTSGGNVFSTKETTSVITLVINNDTTEPSGPIDGKTSDAPNNNALSSDSNSTSGLRMSGLAWTFILLQSFYVLVLQFTMAVVT